MDYRQMTSPCGLDCFNCPMFLASQNEEVRKSVGEELNIDPETVQCNGCRNQGGKIACHGMTEPCPIYLCAQEKGHFCCSDCKEFFCELLQKGSVEKGGLPCNVYLLNLTLIRRMGVDKWAGKKIKEAKKNYYKEKYGL